MRHYDIVIETPNGRRETRVAGVCLADAIMQIAFLVAPTNDLMPTDHLSDGEAITITLVVD